MSVYSLVPYYRELNELDPEKLPDYLRGPFFEESRSLLQLLEKHRSIDSPRYPYPRDNPEGK